MSTRRPPRRDTYVIEFRPVDELDTEQWHELDTATARVRALDVMLGAEGLRELQQGDLVRARQGNVTLGLAVMTARFGVVKAPKMPRVVAVGASADWLSAWEGQNAMADRMLRATPCVGRKRIVLAAMSVSYTSASSAYSPLTMRSAVRAVRASGDVAAANWARNAAKQAAVSASAAAGMDDLAEQNAVLRELAPTVRVAIPLPVELLARLGEEVPFRYVRQNPNAVPTKRRGPRHRPSRGAW